LFPIPEKKDLFWLGQELDWEYARLSRGRNLDYLRDGKVTVLSSEGGHIGLYPTNEKIFNLCNFIKKEKNMRMKTT